MKLYVYEHCPFATSVRVISGLNDIHLDLVVMPFDEEEALIHMVGKKTVPILVKNDGSAMAESVDIIDEIAGLNGIDLPDTQELDKVFSNWLSMFLLTLQRLMYPRVHTMIPRLIEFEHESAREEWERKKSITVGNFSSVLEHTQDDLRIFNEGLSSLAQDIQDKGIDMTNYGLSHARLFSFLRCVSMVRGVTWPASLDLFMADVSEKSGIALWPAKF
jgi:glutaredoxin 2